MSQKFQYVIYSHSDYSDVLTVALDYLKNDSPILLIDRIPENINVADCKNIIYYDESLPYGSRVLTGLQQLSDKYILFIHDMDVLLSKNSEDLNKITMMMDVYGIDRVDLQNTSEGLLLKDMPSIYINDMVVMFKQDGRNPYMYNVNPSIWNRESFIRLLETVPNESYRSIEHGQSQIFSQQNLIVYKQYHPEMINCGYYGCVFNFKFLHLTHGGKYLPETISGNTCDQDVHSLYLNIIDNFKLKETGRLFNLTR